ncbi:MAG: extracellular solute-binding protein [Deltaproteobacteria bacterium]|nr:extracellular solute-binding protein [Deltaproteobacteria bacterium]
MRKQKSKTARGSRFNYARSIMVLILFLAWFTAVPARGQSAHEAKLIAGAKKEGRLVWYTAMAIDTAKPLVDAFEKKNPFVKVDYIRVGTAQMINRVINETLAGKWAFDVVTVLGMDALVKRNIFAPYMSPEREAFVDEFKDSKGLWTGVYHNNVVLAYNTKLVAEKEAPKDYPDLLNAKWKGKIGMDERDYTWYGTLAKVWGREKVDRYMKQLAQLEPQFRRGHALIAQLVAAGELPLGWVYSFRVETMKQDGAPLEWVDTFNPIVVEVGGIGLSAKANNTNAARLFIDFVLSKEGQRVVRGGQRNPRNPSRKDVEPPIARMDQSRLKLKAVPGEVENNLEQYAKEYREMFRIR